MSPMILMRYMTHMMMMVMMMRLNALRAATRNIDYDVARHKVNHVGV